MIETINKARKEQGYSQGSLALKVGVRQATISDFENGKRGLSSVTLEKIFEVLSIDLISKTSKSSKAKD